MTTGATGQLGLALPVQGELSGTWGDTVNNGITQYTNLAIAATLTLTGDGAVTLANTTGDAAATNITSSLAGAGTVTAQHAIVKISGTLTTTKVVTGPSYSKTYVVDNTTATYGVTFKASGQTGVTVAAGEKCTVYYNGTDYVKVASSTADGVTTFSAGTTGLTPSTATSGAVTLAGTLATANGGTNLTSFTANGVVYASSTSALATGSALSFDGTNLGVGITSPTQKLEVAGTTSLVRARIKATTANADINFNNTGADFFVGVDTSVGAVTGTAYSSYIYSTGTTPLLFFTNGSERARLDSAGYLSGVWADKVTALGNSGTATTITCTSGNVFTSTLTGNCTFTLSAPSTTTANTATSFTLILTNDGTAGRTVAFAGGTFKYPGGSVTRTTTANAVDIWFFFSPNGGTTWYVSIPMANLS